MSKRVNPTGEIELLLRIIDQAYEKRAWHGPNLRGSLRGVSAPQAAFRPAPGRKNIWEHVLHAAYWKYIAWRRLTSNKRGSFPVAGSNWFVRPQELSEQAWRRDRQVLDDQHRALRQAIAGLDPRTLMHKPRGSKVDNATLIYGIAAHDLYHTGQIQLLKRLATQ
jgi:uncharacterized damage-inducible protein DinB